MTDAPHNPLTQQAIPAAVERVVSGTTVVDVHTHLYAPRFNQHDPGYLLWGIDELLDYHYLHAEVLRAAGGDLSPSTLHGMAKPDRAELIWRTLFRERAPLSEACRGVVTTLRRLGLDPNSDSLTSIRAWFSQRDLDAHVDAVMRLAGVERLTMTNGVLQPQERSAWLADASLGRDPRFPAVVRIDQLLCDPEAAIRELGALGYDDGVEPDRARRFLSDWIARTNAVYVAASLPPIEGPTRTPSRLGDRVLHEGVFPALAEHGVPLALMIGVRRRVNPTLGSAGDGSGPSDLRPLESLCVQTQSVGVKLLITMLAREDQHGLCVLARKFAHLTPFGCWWFLNTPSLIDEITRMRLELLGPTFIPQHSDARVLEQIIYKWAHSRSVIADVLSDHFVSLSQAGTMVTEPIIEQEVDRLLRGNAVAAIPYSNGDE